MRTRDEIVSRIAEVVAAMGADADRVVFVGGASLALLDLPEWLDARPTKDVDFILDASGVTYAIFLQSLRDRGFRDPEVPGSPMCRLRTPAADSHEAVVIDAMPIDGAVLGFSNRWYDVAFRDALPRELPGGRTVRSIAPLHFVATKLEAFLDRGAGDFVASHDLEDAVAVLATDEPLRAAILTESTPAARWVRTTLASMREPLLDALRGHLPGSPEGEAAHVALAEWLGALDAASG